MESRWRSLNNVDMYKERLHPEHSELVIPNDEDYTQINKKGIQEILEEIYV